MHNILYLSALVTLLNPKGLSFFLEREISQSFEVKSYVLPLALPISENLKYRKAFFFQIPPSPHLTKALL